MQSNEGESTKNPISLPPIQEDILDMSQQPAPLLPNTDPIEPPFIPPTITTRSGRTIKPTVCFLESQQQRQQGVIAYQVEHETIDPHLYREEDLLAELDDPIAFNASCIDNLLSAYKATNNPDTFYMHDALKQPDAPHSSRKQWLRKSKTKPITNIGE
jgi:hypothetical protein